MADDAIAAFLADSSVEGDGVDWDLVDVRLAVADGAEGKKRRDQLFTRLDPNGNRQLSLSEAQAGLGSLLEATSSGNRKTGEVAHGLIPGMTDFRPAIKVAFKVARKLGTASVADSATVDRTEFHALLVYFRHYLELLVIFKRLDNSGDMKLGEDEIVPSIDRLEKWNVTKQQVHSKLQSEGGQISFEHFAEWCVKSTLDNFAFDEHEGEESLPVSPAKSAASNMSGRPSTSKGVWLLVDERIPTAGDPQSALARDALFKQMDLTGTGYLTVVDVQASIASLLACDHADRKKDQAALTILPGIRDTRPAAKCAFAAARDLAPPPGAKKQTSKKKQKAGDDTVDRREFHALLVYLRYYLELQMVFQELDTSEDLRISKEECTAAMPLLAAWGIDKDAVNTRFAEAKGGELKFPSFADWCLRIKLDGHMFDELECDEPEDEPEEMDLDVSADIGELEDVANQLVRSTLPATPKAEMRSATPNLDNVPEIPLDNVPEMSATVTTEDDWRNWGEPPQSPLPEAQRGPGQIRRMPVPGTLLSRSLPSLPMESQGVLRRQPHLPRALSTIRSLPKWKFGEKRPSSFFLTNTNPAPGSYNIPDPSRTGKFREKQANSFGGGPPRFGYEPHPGTVQPAPGQYGIVRNPVQEMQRKVAFSKQPRRLPNAVRSVDPGPGAYEVKSRLGGISCTAKGKITASYRPEDALPGPGQYNPCAPGNCSLSHEKASVMVGFGTSCRTNFADKNCRRGPGPGAYDSDTHAQIGAGSKKFAFSGRLTAPSNFDSYVSPGPGTYDGDGTCFGY